MSEANCCTTCGAKIVEYKHSLVPGIVSALRTLYATTKDPINLNALNLTRNQWDNFQKLKYWDLVKQVGGKKSGIWQITTVGIQFVEERITLQKSVWTYRGEVRRSSGHTVSINDIKVKEEGRAYQRDYETQ